MISGFCKLPSLNLAIINTKQSLFLIYRVSIKSCCKKLITQVVDEISNIDFFYVN